MREVRHNLAEARSCRISKVEGVQCRLVCHEALTERFQSFSASSRFHADLQPLLMASHASLGALMEDRRGQREAEAEASLECGRS